MRIPRTAKFVHRDRTIMRNLSNNTYTSPRSLALYQLRDVGHWPCHHISATSPVLRASKHTLETTVPTIQHSSVQSQPPARQSGVASTSPFSSLYNVPPSEAKSAAPRDRNGASASANDHAASRPSCRTTTQLLLRNGSCHGIPTRRGTLVPRRSLPKVTRPGGKQDGGEICPWV